MYDEVLQAVHYAINMDFGISYRLFYDYVNLLMPTFAAVLGIRIGVSILKQFINSY